MFLCLEGRLSEQPGQFNLQSGHLEQHVAPRPLPVPKFLAPILPFHYFVWFCFAGGFLLTIAALRIVSGIEEGIQARTTTGRSISWRTSVGLTLILVVPPSAQFCLMGIWQNWLNSWARWWNIPNQIQPNQGSPGDGPPCTSCTISS